MAAILVMGVVSGVEKLIDAHSKAAAASASDIISIKILPDQDVIELFGLPDYTRTYTLNGMIHVKAARAMTLRQIRVKFKGTTKVGESKEGGTLPVTGFMARDESLMIVQRNEIILNDHPFALSEGETLIPFSIELPGDLPPTVYTQYGWLEYGLSAIIFPETSRRLSQVFSRTYRGKKIMTVKRNYIRSLEIAPYMPTMRYKGKRPNKLEYEFEVPRVVCKQQGQIDFSAKLKPLTSEARVKRITIRLDQYEEYRVFSKDPRRPSPFQMDMPPLEEQTRPVKVEFDVNPEEPLTWEYPLTLSLPLDSPRIRHDCDTPLIDITHKLRVCMTFVNPEAEPQCWLSFPIIISTIPDAENATLSAVRPDSLIVSDEGEDDELPTYQSLGPNPALPTYDMSNLQVALADVSLDLMPAVSAPTPRPRPRPSSALMAAGWRSSMLYR